MKATQAIQVALKGLGTNRLRSALTMLGVIIGVTSVVSLLSIGRGSQNAITSKIESMGANLLYVQPGQVTEDGVQQAVGTGTTLTLEDSYAIAAEADAVLAVAAQTTAVAQVVAGRQNVRTQLLGVTPEYESVRNFPVADGYFFSVTDLQNTAMVVVLGSNVATRLFPDTNPVGQMVRINTDRYEVIGVLVSKGSTTGGNQDDQILAPITTVQMRFSSQTTSSGERVVQMIYVQAKSKKVVDTAIAQITAILEERHRITDGASDDFIITNQQDTIAALQQTTQVWVIFLGAIAGISLLVGGIGIMNIMLVSVTERTREIGIRKAVGAKKGDILLQFLAEAAILSFVGGGIGVVAGYGVSHLISGISLTGQAIQTIITPDIPLLAVGVSAAIGIIFGLYPAFRAANLKPIEALRYE
jgi:putative ABC transport system permease protein